MSLKDRVKSFLGVLVIRSCPNCGAKAKLSTSLFVARMQVSCTKCHLTMTLEWEDREMQKIARTLLVNRWNGPQQGGIV